MRMRVIQIGVGHDHAHSIIDEMLKREDLFEVVAFAVPESEKKDFANKVQEYQEIRKVKLLSVEKALDLPDLDGAVIETEELNLVKYALMAAERGLHIHMDKPGGVDVDEFEKLVNVVKNNHLTLSMGYMYRYNPKIMEAFRRVKQGELGEIFSVEAQMNCYLGAGKRQWLERFPGGMMFYLGCHLVDLIYRLQGEPLEIIPLNCTTGLDGVTADDFGMVVFRYQRGISFAKCCMNEYGGFERRQLVISGSKGTLEIRPLEYWVINENGNMGVAMTEKFERGWEKPGIVTRVEGYNRYDELMQHFYNMSMLGEEAQYSPDYELQLYKLVLRTCGGMMNNENKTDCIYKN